MRGSQILNLALRLQLECMLECVRQILLELIPEPAVYQILVLHDSELAKFELYTHPRSVILSDLGGDNHDCLAGRLNLPYILYGECHNILGSNAYESYLVTQTGTSRHRTASHRFT